MAYQTRSERAARGDTGQTGRNRYQVTGQPMAANDFARAMGGAYGQARNPFDRTAGWGLTRRGRDMYNKYMSQFGDQTVPDPGKNPEEGGPRPDPEMVDTTPRPVNWYHMNGKQQEAWNAMTAEQKLAFNSRFASDPKYQNKITDPKTGPIDTGGGGGIVIEPGGTASANTGGGKGDQSQMNSTAASATYNTAGVTGNNAPTSTPAVNGYEQFNQRGMPVASKANLLGNQMNTWQQRMAGRGGGAMSSTQGQVAPQRNAAGGSMRTGPNPAMAQPNAPLGLMVPGSY